MTPSELTIGHGLGGVAFWTSARAPRSVVRAAADAAGIGHLVPDDPPPTTVLRDAMLATAESVYGKVRKQPFLVRRLEDPGTFECVRVQTGQVKNLYQPLFSASVDRDWNVGILWTNGSDVSGLRDAVAEGRDYFTATDVSAIAIRALRDWHATLLKQDGGVWFVPGPLLEPYRAWAMGLRFGAGCPQYHVTTFEIGSDPDTVGHVLASLTSEIVSGVTAITDDMLAAEGGMQDRSIKVREARAQALLDKVRAYEGYTGNTLTTLADAVVKVQQALAMSKLLSASV